MQYRGRSVLGIDIVPGEVRIVEVAGQWPDLQVVRAASAPTPGGAVDGGRVTAPDAVASVIRAVLAQMGTTTRDAVLALADRGVTIRVLEMPSVPDSEARTVIEGELEHYQILRSDGGAFDYWRLDEPGDAGAVQTLVVAADALVINGYTQATERAGLRLVAVEPAGLALLRTALLHVGAEPSVACLTVGYGRTEIAILDDGKLRLFRRIDIGTDDLIRGRARGPATGGSERTAPVADRVMLGDEPVDEEHRQAPAGGVVTATAGNLAIDVQRSLDYYRREFPQSPPLESAVLATNDPAAEPLARWLSEALHLDIAVARPPKPAPGQEEGLRMPASLRFAAAAGSAAGAVGGVPDTVPRLDLSMAERVEPEVAAARGKMVLALAAAVVLIAAGLVGGYLFGMRANVVEHGLEHEQQYLALLQGARRQRLSDLMAQAQEVRALKAAGYPVPRIVDVVSGALDPAAGLTDFGLTRDGRMTMTGEATDERAMIGTLDGLRRAPYFAGTMLESFDSSAPSTGPGQARVVRFQLSAQVVGAQGTATGGVPAAGGSQ